MDDNPFAPPEFNEQLSAGDALFDPLRTRELALGEILSMAAMVFARAAQPIVVISVLVYLPINIALAASGLGVDEDLKNFARWFRAQQLLDTFFGIFAMLTVARLTEGVVTGRPLGLGAALSHAVSRWASAAWTRVLGGFLVGLLMLLLVVPGVIASVMIMFADPIVALRNRSGSDALQYSRSLVTGRWWKVLGYHLMFGLIALVPAAMAGVAVEFLPASQALEVAAETVGDVCMSFFVVASTVYFLNCDARLYEVDP